jgi:hypothetical protein
MPRHAALPPAARLALAMVSCLLSAAAPRAAAAQAWDTPGVRALVARAIARRTAALADTGLKDFSARAHGFVFFLGQIGEGLSEPPRLVKADQLELQVYWKAPNLSKQRIIGWRDRMDLPTDISYHRDHLGIALNNFPDRIRLGEGDEVRDVPHPLAANGPELYEYALKDSTTIRLPDRDIMVYEVAVRPRDYRAPRLVGSIFLDVDLGDLVRMAFQFTRPAYLDPQLEDITVAIENSLWAGRYWLPYRQEIAIRRRFTWLDFPVRGIIQGRWEIDRYAINEGVDDAMFRSGGPEIVMAQPEVRDSFPWRDSLSAQIREFAEPARLEDFAAVRAEVEAVAAGHVLDGLKRAQFGGGSVSDFAHFNRVEGLALGLGTTVRSGDDATVFRLRGGAATATPLVTGGAELAVRRSGWTWRLGGSRSVRDLGDEPVISRVVNSLLAQETGTDYGDYYLATGGEGSATLALGGRTTFRLSAGWDRVDSLQAHASWARGEFSRPNNAVGAGSWSRARLSLRRLPPSFTTVRSFSGRLELEGGSGTSGYLRGYGDVRWQVPAGSGWLVARASVGAGTRDLPAHRSFVLGGRGTLLGEGFRAFAGRQLVWASLDLRLPVSFPELPLGSYAGTGRTVTVIPFVAAGWTGGAAAPGLGASTRGFRPVVGLGLEWFHDLLRLDVGYALRTGRFGGAIDVSRDFWDIL